MQQKTVAKTGTLLFYLGGAVWVVYAIVKYLLGWDVSLRQFLPYHLTLVIPGIILKRGAGLMTAFFNKR